MAAGPEIVSVSLEPRPAGALADLVVEARDAKAEINGISVGSSGLRTAFGESGCRTRPKGVGQGVVFRIPVEPLQIGALEVAVTITSGACGPAPRTWSQRVALDLPALPGAGAPATGPLGIEIPLAPVARSSAKARASAAPATEECPDADLMPERFVLPRVRAATVCLMNRERANAGVIELKTSRQLRRAARWHAIDMLQRRYFDHRRPDGPTFAERIRSAGYIATTAGENIGYGTEYMATPRQMVTAWRESRPHRENMLDPNFRAVGIAVAVPASVVPHEPGATYTVDFAKRR